MRSAPYPPLYVLRHGETLWNVEGRLQGALDSPLTELGRAQALRQGEILRGVDLAGYACLTSPQGRAVATAELALGGRMAIRPEPHLREIGIGAWAGESRAELAARTGLSLSGFSFYDHAPGGEGFAALEARCSTFLANLAGPTVLVSHGITSRMIRALAQGLDRKSIADVGGGQGIVYYLENGVQKRLE